MCRAGSKSNSPRARGRSRSGLTLIELMVVVVVMAVLAGALAPNLISAVDRFGMDRATAQVADLLDFAAGAAVARRQPVVVQFDPEHHACRACLCVTELPWLAEDATPQATVLASLRLPDGVDVEVFHGIFADTDTEKQGQGGDVRFWPDRDADDAEVRLSDARGRHEVLPVRALTGEVIFVEEE